MMTIISFEFYLISKFTKTMSLMSTKNQTLKIESPKCNNGPALIYCKDSYTWCLNDCYRHISRHYGVAKDYDSCKQMCQHAFGNHDKKVDF